MREVDHPLSRRLLALVESNQGTACNQFPFLEVTPVVCVISELSCVYLALFELISKHETSFAEGKPQQPKLWMMETFMILLYAKRCFLNLQCPHQETEGCNHLLALYHQPVPSSQLVAPVQFSVLELYGCDLNLVLRSQL